MEEFKKFKSILKNIIKNIWKNMKGLKELMDKYDILKSC
jgi:hypothetical protein